MDEIYEALINQISLREEEGFATPEELRQRDRIIFKVFTRSFIKPEDEETLYKEYWTTSKEQKDTLVALLLIKARMESELYNFKWIKAKDETIRFVGCWRALLPFLCLEQRRDIFQRPIVITRFEEALGPALLTMKDEILSLFGPIPLPPVPLVLFNLMCHQINCVMETRPEEVKVSALPHTELLVFE